MNASQFDYVAAVAQVCALYTKVFSNTVAQIYSSNSTIIRAVFPSCQMLAAQSLELYTCNCRETQLNLVLTLFCQDIEEEEYSRAYSQALHEGEAKNNRIPIMLVGQDRGGKTSLMRRLLGLPFDKDQPSTTGIDVNVIELTEQNAEDPWKKREVKKFMSSESEAKSMLYKKTAEYLDRGVQRNLEGDAPEPLKPVKPLLREEISKIKSQRSTEHDQNKVLRVFVSDFAGQSIYYDTHGCFVKPHCPYVLVHDLSLEFDKPAVPKFKKSNEEKEIEINNPYFNTNFDNFTSWLKFLQGLGECQDQQFPDKSGYCTTAKGENFKRPPVLIALTHNDKVKGNDSKIVCVQNRINNVVSEGKYENVIPEFLLIDSTLEGDDGDDVRKLRRKLFDLSNAVLNKEFLMPVKWLDFEAALSQELSPDCKYIPVDEANREAEACGVGLPRCDRTPQWFQQGCIGSSLVNESLYESDLHAWQIGCFVQALSW